METRGVDVVVGVGVLDAAANGSARPAGCATGDNTKRPRTKPRANTTTRVAANSQMR
jgi:hypothetical protein